ncbi:MAG: AAA family ATPase [Actinomycetota bacterium]
MRPLELTLEGFKSYREQHTFNFESRSLFGIVGPTGAGKSSILEALIFGFFGKTPRLERDTKKLIHSAHQEAKVQVSFESGASAWEVTRVIRTKGASHVVLKRLDGPGDPVIGDRAVNERIAEILGLDFGAFCASVSLPQGEFDRFLKATSAERVRILKGAFGLEKINQLREAAKGRWSLINAEMMGLQAARNILPENPVEAALELSGLAAAANERAARVSEALPAVRRAEQDLDRSSTELASTAERRKVIFGALADIPPAEDLLEIESANEQAIRRYEAAEREGSRAAEVFKEANTLAESFDKLGRGEVWCANLESEIRTYRQLLLSAQGVADELVQVREKVQEADRNRVEALKAHGDQEAQLASARAHLLELQQEHRAHLLRSDLTAGAPCPVCEQLVASPPSTKTPRGLGEADVLVADAEKNLSKTGRAFQGASELHILAVDRVQSAQSRIESAAASLKATEAQLFELAGGASDPEQELAAAREQLDASKASLKAAMSEHEEARAAEKYARVQVEQLSAKHQSFVAKVTHVCGQLALDRSLLEEEGLAAAAKRALEAGKESIKALDLKAERIRLTAIDARRVIDEFRTVFEALAEDSTSDVMARVAAEASRLEKELVEAEKAIKAANQIEADIKTIVEDKALYDRLTADLTDHKFTAHLLEEQRRTLSILASEKFQELTGRYVFDEQGDFQVLDLRTGAVRSPDTLSGGEGFLASLSLALALAETVGREGGALGCFFLDEGFGSLDSESLELALDGIEALAVPGRLIGLISHVGGIQSRLDDLIVLERNDDGSTSVIQDGGPIGYATSMF